MTDTLHWSFDDPGLMGIVFPLGLAAENSTLPEPGFDPSSDWDCLFDVVQTGSLSLKDRPFTVTYGQLRLKREGMAGGRVRFHVTRTTHMQQREDSEVQVTRAVFEVADSPPCSLCPDTPWQVTSEVRGRRDPATARLGDFKECGRVRAKGDGWVIEKDYGGASFRPFAELPKDVPLTTNWGLLNAVQAMPPDAHFSFAMLQNLDKLCLNQRLVPLAPFEAIFGGRLVALHGYAHVGEGTMPSFYWVNADNRLVIARYGMVALVSTNQAWEGV